VGRGGTLDRKGRAGKPLYSIQKNSPFPFRRTSREKEGGGRFFMFEGKGE